MTIDFLTNSTKFLLSSLLFLPIGTALAGENDNGDENDDGKRHRVRVVDCSHPHASIQRTVDRVTRRLGDRPVTILITGVCKEDVTIKKNDLTLEGDGGTVDGTITIRTARWVVIRHLEVTGSGAGVVGTENAAFTVEYSTISYNDTDGIDVEDGAHATITHNDIKNNGRAALPDSGRGVVVNDGGNAHISNNFIEDNRSDGIGVFNGAFARVEENMIERNGNAVHFDAGINVSRATVRANGNVIKNNGYAGVEVFNAADYRTGTFVNPAGNLDNLFPFEQIEKGAGVLAVEVGRNSFADLRQVNVTGNIDVFATSIVQVRGDTVGPNKPCSTVAGTVSVFGPNSVAQLRQVNVTSTFFDSTRSTFIQFGSNSPVCPPASP